MNTLTLLQEFGNCLRTPSPETLDQAEILARRSLEIIQSLQEFPLQDQSVDLLKNVYQEDLPRLRTLLITRKETELVPDFRSMMQNISEGIRLAVEYRLKTQAETDVVIVKQDAA